MGLYSSFKFKHSRSAFAPSGDVVLKRDIHETTGLNTQTTRFSGPYILNSSNTAIQRTFSLPGGVTVAQPLGGGDTSWSHPNSHGDVAWTANAAGVQTGTYEYDPFGQPIDRTTGLMGSATADDAVPNQMPGEMDPAWLGKHGKGYEHLGTIATIEMGVRMFSPMLKRFLSMDPMEGGVDSLHSTRTSFLILRSTVPQFLSRRPRPALTPGLAMSLWH